MVVGCYCVQLVLQESSKPFVEVRLENAYRDFHDERPQYYSILKLEHSIISTSNIVRLASVVGMFLAISVICNLVHQLIYQKTNRPPIHCLPLAFLLRKYNYLWYRSIQVLLRLPKKVESLPITLLDLSAFWLTKSVTQILYICSIRTEDNGVPGLGE